MTYPTIMPAITLDFQNSQQLDPRVTFSRSSGATYVNSAGLVATAAEHEPRFDHDPVTGECLGLLIEESRTNEAPYSETFQDNGDDTGWRTSGGTVTPSAGTSPSNGAASSIDGSIYKRLDWGAAGTQNATSVYVKAGTGTTGTLSCANGNAGGISFDLVAGTVTPIYTCDGTFIEAVGNGWFRIGFNRTSTSTVTAVNLYLTTTPGETVLFWGVQVEKPGTFSTSYIPTTSSSTVIRSQDIAQITGDNFSSWYNQGEGSFIVTSNKVDALPDLQFTVMTTDGYRLPEFTFRSNSRGTVYTPIIGSYTSLSPVVRATFGAAFDGTGMSSYINGAGNSVANTNIVDTNTTLYLGNYINSASFLLTGHISRFAYYNERLTDAELQTLTS
jgi:hypothetical protein